MSENIFQGGIFGALCRRLPVSTAIPFAFAFQKHILEIQRFRSV